MKIVGVDPGGRGALALIHGPRLEIADMPVLMVRRGRTDKPELDVHAVYDLLAGWAPDTIFFEQVGGMTGESASSAFNFGRIAGMCEAVARRSGARFELVSPVAWKKAHRLKGGKDDGRARAMAIWPEHAALFRRKMDDGRADAALIAEYGRIKLGLARAEDVFA